jgi:hypothetical protein
VTSVGARQLSLWGTVLAIWLAGAGICGCVGFIGLDSNLLTTLGLSPSPVADDGGNVVVTYTNATDKPVQWRLAWQQAGSTDPSTLAVTIQPGQTKTFSVEGTVERIAAGSLDDDFSIAAIVDPAGANPHTISYSGGRLQNGVDFRSGDIIRYNISPSGPGKYLISAEIARGG